MGHGNLQLLWIGCSWKPGTDEGRELIVALCFVSLLRLVKCFANERASRREHPLTLRASEALEILDLNPNQLA